MVRAGQDQDQDATGSEKKSSSNADPSSAGVIGWLGGDGDVRDVHTDGDGSKRGGLCAEVCAHGGVENERARQQLRARPAVGDERVGLERSNR